MAVKAIGHAAILGAMALLASPQGKTQPTHADYERALGLQEKYRGTVDHAPDAPQWIPGSSHFIYRRSTVASAGREAGQEYIWVDADSGATRPAFDPAKLASAFAKAFGDTVKPEALALGNYQIV